MNGKILKIVICSMILLIGIGAACAAELNSTDDAAALDGNDEVAAVQTDDVAIVEESDVLAAEDADVVDGDVVDVEEDEVLAAEDADVVYEEDVLSEDVDVVSSEDAEDVLAVDDVVVSNEGFIGDVTAGETLTLKDMDLTVSPDAYVGYGSKYKTFKGKSHYKWKIKRSKWKKMKKQAKKQYKKLRSYGSHLPGYSDGVTVKVKIGGYKYRLTAFAVRNYKGIRCEVRGLYGGYRLSTWGDYYA